jgi:DNA mismatch repair protein MutS
MPATIDHYHAAKLAHPGLLLLFRVGDFYETFDADAETVASVCGARPGPARGCDAFVAFPRQGLEANLRKLLRAGHRVAVLDAVKE